MRRTLAEPKGDTGLGGVECPRGVTSDCAMRHHRSVQLKLALPRAHAADHPPVEPNRHRVHGVYGPNRREPPPDHVPHHHAHTLRRSPQQQTRRRPASALTDRLAQHGPRYPRVLLQRPQDRPPAARHHKAHGSLREAAHVCVAYLSATKPPSCCAPHHVYPLRPSNPRPDMAGPPPSYAPPQGALLRS